MVQTSSKWTWNLRSFMRENVGLGFVLKLWILDFEMDNGFISEWGEICWVGWKWLWLWGLIPSSPSGGHHHHVWWAVLRAALSGSAWVIRIKVWEHEHVWSFGCGECTSSHTIVSTSFAQWEGEILTHSSRENCSSSTKFYEDRRWAVILGVGHPGTSPTHNAMSA